MVNNKDTVEKASKGYIEDYYNSAESKGLAKDQVMFGAKPIFDREKALEAVRKDSTVMSALNTLVDKAMDNGYRLEGVDGKSKQEPANKTLREKLRFSKVLRQAFYNLFAYGNVFIENVKDGNGNIKELHVLETTTIEPVTTAHGEVLHYQQVIPQDDSPVVTWEPDEITHIAITKLTTNVWGELDIEAIYTSVLIKQYIYAFLGWLYGTNQFKGFYNIKSGSDVQVKEFLSFLRSAEHDIAKPVIAQGEIEYQILRDFKDGDSIINLINKCDSNILSLMQVPPVSAGEPGDSNRSNSDAQTDSLLIRIKAVQNVVEDECNYDLFKKIDFDKLRLIFNPLKQANISKLLEDAERMKIVGFKTEVIEEFLKNEGFPLQSQLLYTDEEQVKRAEMMNPSPEKSQDMFASKKGKQEGEGNKRVGTGEKGTTREDQISKGYTVTTSKFGKFPYTYEVEEK